MFIRNAKHFAIAAAMVALLSPNVQATSTITIYASPTVGSVATDLVSDFLSVTGDLGLGYNVRLQIMSDTDAQAAIIAAAATGTGPDLFLSKSTASPNAIIADGISLDGQLIKFAKDSLVLYSSAEKVANIQSVLTNGTVDNVKLELSSLTVSIPDPALNDPYGLSAQKLLGGSKPSSWYSKLDNSGVLVKSIDSVSAYGSVRYVDKVDGGTDLAFTGLNQICNALDGTKHFEPGAKQWVIPSVLGLDIQLAGVALVNSANQSNPAQYQELTDFVSFLTGTALAEGAKTGKDTLAEHCYH
ncbi:molybdate ABC transporter substrate-binding protein [Methylovulum miyakonense]|uniref:molybdate ABC transporter substrate-binding protein n=1 Tax=Methylovulum miyakonense TaxID=645578 RepID=UPI0003655361|nr:substrate-binding domain-containing protein [Methylovulum miyakonense]